jgi:hypothetical protein
LFVSQRTLTGNKDLLRIVLLYHNSVTVVNTNMSKVLPDILGHGVLQCVTTYHIQCLFTGTLLYKNTMYGIFLCIMTTIGAGSGNSRFPDEVITEYRHDGSGNKEVSS